MTNHAVVIAGAGPTGLMLAGELALAGVDVAGGQSMHAQFLVGCDGGRSLIRKAAGIDFPGWDPTTSNILAEVEMTEKPPYGVHRSAAGMYAFGRPEYEIRGSEIIYKDVGP